MAFNKFGEATVVTSSDIRSADSVLSDPEILNRFQKVATELKSIAPKAKDFLYFSAVMMHAAEAALLNSDGSFRKDANGQDVTATWEQNGDSWRWKCSDSSIRPVKNANGDIFPESELIKAHKKWIEKPLCLDHKSASVDMVRGIIIDTYYDYKHKRIIALCALDKVNYPDLARKVATGYATSVSMGTGVGKAICFDCGTVAKTEADFCNCMRGKSCYGEINVDLNPIELSIVVNGADPDAKIRHIVAEANSIARYVDMKKNQLSKLSQDSKTDLDKEHVEEAADIEESLDDVIKKLEQLKIDVNKLKEEERREVETDYHGDSKAASLISEINKLRADVNILQNGFQKLSSVNKDKMSQNKEDLSKVGYYNGTVEPTPGKPQYAKEDSDSIRDKQDKQMVGEPPFPGVGNVDGMYPGDEEKKRELHRLAKEQKDREMRRLAALQKAKENLSKNSYYNGTIEPTPGKPQYAKEDSDSTRDKQDKQMVGAPPFPGVGKVDGLYGDDLKKKEMLSRAKLSAALRKAAKADGSLDKENTFWVVTADNNVILTAFVKELTNGKVDALYDAVTTKEFGKNLLSTIRSEGIEKATLMFKGGQAAPPAATNSLPMPAPAPTDSTPDAMPDKPTDTGGSGDPAEGVDKIIDDLEGNVSDLREGIESLKGEEHSGSSEFDQLAGGEMGAPTTASLVNMKQKLGRALLIGMKKAKKEIKENIKELKIASNLIRNKEKIQAVDRQKANSLINETVKSAKINRKSCYDLMAAFVDYAEGTATLTKFAQRGKTAQPVNPIKTNLDYLSERSGRNAEPALSGRNSGQNRSELEGMLQNVTREAPGSTKGKGGFGTGVPMGSPEIKQVPDSSPADDGLEHDLPERSSGKNRAELEKMLKNVTQEAPGSTKGKGGYGTGVPLGAPEIKQIPDSAPADDCMADDTNDVVKINNDGSLETSNAEEAGKAMKAMKNAGKDIDLNTKEGRAIFRAKLAEKGAAFSEMLKVHKGGVTPGGIDNKPAGDLAKIETLEETHSAMMDVATAPPKVKKQAEEIQKFVLKGQINPETDFPQLISNGIDPEAVKYWKAFYGQMKDGGSQFAAELLKEHNTKKASIAQENTTAKITRAYELAYDMARRGQISDDNVSVSQQAKEFMGFNDEGFESMKRWVERQPVVKQASVMPQMGVGSTLGLDSQSVNLPLMQSSDLVAEYSKLFEGRKLRNF